MSKTYSVPPAPPHNEGKTTAAWVMTVGVVAGSVVAALGLIQASPTVMIIGSAVMAATVVLSVVLALAGFGQKRRKAARP